MSIIGIVLHNDGKRWKYECCALLLRCCGIKSLLLAIELVVEELINQIKIDIIIDVEILVT